MKNVYYACSTYKNRSQMVCSMQSTKHKRLDDLIAAKERELAKVTQYKQSLYQDWKDWKITQQEYRTMKADYEQQAERLSDIIERLTAERQLPIFRAYQSSVCYGWV